MRRSGVHAEQLFKIIFLTSFITTFLTTNISAAQANHQNWDSALSAFIEGTIPNSELVNSTFVTHSVQLLNPSNGRTETINDKIDFSVYTFKRTDDTEPKYDTIIDYQFKEPMKVKQQDRLEVQISEHLRPVTPIKNIMLTKENPNESWKFLKEPTPVMNSLQSFTVEGDELSNSDGFSRMMIHFSSYSNSEFIADDPPKYEIKYTHDSSTYLTFSKIQGISFLAIAFLFLYYLLSRRERRQTTGSF